MNEEEYERLGKVITRLGNMLHIGKVDYKESSNVYAWGLVDGLEKGYDMIKAFYDTVPLVKKPIGHVDQVA